MKVLITGGSGFIGSHIAEYFQGKAEVYILDNLKSGHRKNLKDFDVKFFENSIQDRKVVREVMQGVDYVFHLAAMVSVAESMFKPIECAQVNVEGFLNVLEEAAAAKVKKVCLSSSAAIYGNNPTVPKIESMIPEPKSPYAITKLDGEYYCNFFSMERKLPTTCLRYFNVFGPRQDPKSQYAAAVPIFIEKALKNEPLIIFGDGEQTRDFVYVKDVVEVNVHAAMNPTMEGVFNVGYGTSLSINDLARKIIELTNSKSEIQYRPERAGDVKHSRAACEKIQSTGFRPKGTLEAGLRETIASMRQMSEVAR
jgi:UDP-glucose 4-epimerase